MTADDAQSFSDSFLRHDPGRLFAYLYFGYEPDRRSETYLKLLRDHAGAWAEERRVLRRLSLPALVKRGVSLFEAAMRRSLQGVTSGLQVVRLSGGLDSRLILGGLLEHLPPSQILAVTVGTKGGNDYEIPRFVARRAGIRHERLEMRSFIWTTDELTKCALTMGVPAPLVYGQRFGHYKLHTGIGSEFKIWDGYLGFLSKGDSPDASRFTWSQAIAETARKNGPAADPSVLPPGYSPESFYPAEPWHPSSTVGFMDQLNLLTRQANFILNGRVLRGFDIETPFADPDWMGFWFSVPSEYRADRFLFKSITEKMYPRLFRLPSTVHAGGSLVRPNVLSRAKAALRRTLGTAWTAKGHDRYNPSGGFSKRSTEGREDIKQVVRENLESLAGRGLIDWIDTERLLSPEGIGAGTFRTRQALVSLEINLKASDAVRARSI